MLSIHAPGYQPYARNIAVGTSGNEVRIRLKLRTVTQSVVVTAYGSSIRLSPDANTDAFDLSESVFGVLPLEVNDLGTFLGTFLSPAEESLGGGASIVVDGVEGEELDMPTSAVQKLKMNHDPYSVEYQHPGGARAEVKTKKGHRHLEGSVAFFARNSAFDARNALALVNPPLNRDLVETSLGGPLWGPGGKFFVAGESYRDDESAIVAAVNTPALAGPLHINVPNPRRKDNLFLGTHWSLTPSQWLSVNATFNSKWDNNDGVGGFVLPEQGYSKQRTADKLQVIYALAGSPQLFNQASFLYRNEHVRSGDAATGPALVVSGAFTGGDNQNFVGERRHSFDLQDTATYWHGRNRLLFGGTLWNDWWNAFDATNCAGTFEFASLKQYIDAVDTHSGTAELFQAEAGSPDVDYLIQQASGFFQDTFTALPNLNITAGLRYDWQSTLRDENDFAPRVEVAYAATREAKTVFRAGLGVFYDGLPRTAFQNALLLNGSRIREIDFTEPSYPDPYQSGQLTTTPPSLMRISPAARSPYLMQTSASVEREVAHGGWLSVTYSYLHGVHLFRIRDANAPLPGTDARPDASFSDIEQYESTAFLRGWALKVTFRGDLGRFFRGYAQYVLSKYVNDVSSDGSGGFAFPADNYNLQAEVGRADFDRRNRLNFAGTLTLPRRFRLGSILSVASGAPFDITTGSDPFGDALPRPSGVTRNSGSGPATIALDARISRVFELQRGLGAEAAGRQRVEISLDAFNVINHVNPTSIVGVVTSPLFGQPSGVAAARTLQLSTRYVF